MFQKSKRLKNGGFFSDIPLEDVQFSLDLQSQIFPCSTTVVFIKLRLKINRPGFPLCADVTELLRAEIAVTET